MKIEISHQERRVNDISRIIEMMGARVGARRL
jgi:hypothetical protein